MTFQGTVYPAIEYRDPSEPDFPFPLRRPPSCLTHLNQKLRPLQARRHTLAERLYAVVNPFSAETDGPMASERKISPMSPPGRAYRPVVLCI